MLTIKENNNIKMKEIIHRNLRKNNIDKCEWIKNNITSYINIPIQEEKNFLVFDENEFDFINLTDSPNVILVKYEHPVNE